MISDTYRIILKDTSGPPFSPDIPLVQVPQIWTGPNEKNDRPAMVVSLAPVAVEWDLQLQNLGRMIVGMLVIASDCCGFPASSSSVVGLGFARGTSTNHGVVQRRAVLFFAMPW